MEIILTALIVVLLILHIKKKKKCKHIKPYVITTIGKSEVGLCTRCNDVVVLHKGIWILWDSGNYPTNLY